MLQTFSWVSPVTEKKKKNFQRRELNQAREEEYFSPVAGIMQLP